MELDPRGGLPLPRFHAAQQQDVTLTPGADLQPGGSGGRSVSDPAVSRWSPARCWGG